MSDSSLVVEFELIRQDGSLSTTRYLSLPDGLSAEEADDYMIEHITPIAADYADWQYEIVSRSESSRRADRRVAEARQTFGGGVAQ